jgi:hypothetical protein
MTNFNGFYFNEALSTEFKLLNLFAPQINEFNIMGLGLYNPQGDGYKFSNITDYTNAPSFRLEKIINDINTTLLEYIQGNNTFDFKTNRVAGAAPVNDSDYVTKGFLNDNIITDINYTTSSQGLIVSSSTSGGTENLTTDLNQNLNSLAGLANVGVVLSDTAYSYSVAPLGTSGQLFTIDVDGQPKFKSPQTVTSVGIASTSSGLNITGSPITTSGTININLGAILQSLASLQNDGIVAKLGTAISTIAMGSNNQVLAVQNNAFAFIDRLSSVAVMGSNGLSITGSPITTSGTINITLSNILQSLALLGTNGLIIKNSSTISSVPVPTVNGQILSSSNGTPTWITPAVGGNVTGAGTTTVNALSVWGNTIGTQLNNSTITLDASSNLNMNSKRIVSVSDPVNDQDVTTKLFVQNLIVTILAQYIRTGTVYVGDVGGVPTGTVTVAGDITSASKTNPSSSSTTITINYANLGYTPLVFCQWFDTTSTSVANDIWVPTVQSRSTTQAKIYLEETGTVGQNGTLHIILIKLGIN